VAIDTAARSRSVQPRLSGAIIAVTIGKFEWFDLPLLRLLRMTIAEVFFPATPDRIAVRYVRHVRPSPMLSGHWAQSAPIPTAPPADA